MPSVGCGPRSNQFKILKSNHATPELLCDLSHPNNTLARTVNTPFLNSASYIELFPKTKKKKKNFSGKLLCSYAFFGSARNGVNHGGTLPVRLQAPSYKGCTAVPPVPPFLKLFFQKIFFWEKYYIEARFLHQAPRTALRALFPVPSLEHILLQVDDFVIANPIPSNGVVDGIGVQS